MDSDCIQIEKWRDIKGWESLYQVSNFGRVKSKDKCVPHWRGGDRVIKGRILRQFVRKRYLSVNLCYEYNRLCATVHRLVCEAFHENKNNYPVTNHKDCNPMNNRADNLEWCDISYNTKHAWDNGRFTESKLYKHNR